MTCELWLLSIGFMKHVQTLDGLIVLADCGFGNERSKLKKLVRFARLMGSDHMTYGLV